MSALREGVGGRGGQLRLAKIKDPRLSLLVGAGNCIRTRTRRLSAVDHPDRGRSDSCSLVVRMCTGNEIRPTAFDR